MRTALKVLSMVLSALAMAAGAWQKQSGPLKTRWWAGVDPSHVLPEYPRPQLVRSDWLNLNGIWEFQPNGGDSLPAAGALPSEILVPYAVESPLSGVYKRLSEGKVWYRRSFTVPAGWAGKRVLLHLDGVDWESRVYVNRQLAGSHQGAWDRFTLDITDRLQGAGQQEILVFAHYGGNTLGPDGKFVIGGIWKTVWLEPAGEASVAAVRAYPDVAGGRLRVRVEGRGNLAGTQAKVTVRAGGAKVGEAAGAPGDTLSVPIPDATLWDPSHPFLYDLSATLSKGGSVVDTAASYAGMRQVAAGPDGGATRLLLNGKPLFQIGLLDQGYWPDGHFTPPADEAYRFDLGMAKALGFNLLRKHVKVESDRYYYWCDRMGLLVWQDMPHNSPSEMSDARKPPFEAQLARMVDTHADHPCVAAWVLFNEGWGAYDIERLVDTIRAHDRSRPVDAHTGGQAYGYGDFVDNHNYNYPGSPDATPGKVSAVGEFGGTLFLDTGHAWAGSAMCCTQWCTKADTREDLNDRYQSLLSDIKTQKDDPKLALAAAVYTQVSDVETEYNGMLTYDRESYKLDTAMVRRANQALYADWLAQHPVALAPRAGGGREIQLVPSPGGYRARVPGSGAYSLELRGADGRLRWRIPGNGAREHALRLAPGRGLGVLSAPGSGAAPRLLAAP